MRMLTSSRGRVSPRVKDREGSQSEWEVPGACSRLAATGVPMIHSGHRPLHPPRASSVPALGSPPRGRCRDRRDRRGRHGGRRDQHPGRQRHADHVPGPARVRLRAGHGERVEHDRPRAGSVSGAIGYRRELAGQRDARAALRRRVAARRHHRRGAAAACCRRRRSRRSCRSSSPSRSCSIVAPAAARPPGWPSAAAPRARTAPGCRACVVYLAGVYGGYFGAAQGILLLAILGARAARRPPAHQRPEERARRDRERRRGARLRRRRRTWTGGRPR